jgi:hypothetical protein
MDRDDAVTVPRLVLETLLRSSFPGFSADDFDAAAHLGRDADMRPEIENRAWRDELTQMVQFGLREGSGQRSLDMDVQWYETVGQAIIGGAISETAFAI